MYWKKKGYERDSSGNAWAGELTNSEYDESETDVLPTP
jgi:hypothetical protein